MTDKSNNSFDDILEDLTKRIKGKEGFGDAYKSSTTQTFLEAVADITENLHYMLERRSRENFFPTAKLDSSIKALANSFGYRPRRIVSSKGTVKIKILDSETGEEIVPEGTIKLSKFTPVFFKDYEFVITEEVEIRGEDDESSKEFQIAQGTTKEIVVDPNEDNTLSKYGYILIEDYSKLDNDEIEVFTEDEDFEDIRKTSDLFDYESIAFAGPDDPVYDIRIAHDGLRIIFGDDEFGKRPESTVTVRYLETDGDDVNIRKTDIKLELEDSQLEDDVNVTPPNEYDYEIVSTSEISGGLEAETVDQIRLKAPEFIRSANRAVTNNDFRYWALQSGIAGIVDAYSYGEEEIGIDVFNMNNVYLTYLKEDGSELTAEEKKDLKEYFDFYKLITTQMIFKKANIEDIAIDLRIGRHKELEISNSELFDLIKKEIEEWFEFEEGSIDRNFYRSDLEEHLKTLEIERDDRTYKVARWVSLDTAIIKDIEVDSEEENYEVELNTPLIRNEDKEIQFEIGSFELLDEDLNVIGEEDDPDHSDVSENYESVLEYTIVENNSESESESEEHTEIYKAIVNHRDGIVTFDYLPSGTFYLRYQQNEDMNVLTNVRSTFSYKPFVEKYIDDQDKNFSKIEIL